MGLLWVMESHQWNEGCSWLQQLPRLLVGKAQVAAQRETSVEGALPLELSRVCGTTNLALGSG